MPKKEQKKAKKKPNLAKKLDKKELEKMIEEEQKKLLKKKKVVKKKKKAEKKGKELSDKVKVKKRADGENIHKKIDYHRFLEQQQIKIDYLALFNYLGNLKKPEYEYTRGIHGIVNIVYKKEETISWEEIKEFTEEWKMDQMSNFNRSFEVSDKRTAYKWWKYLNIGIAQFLYEVTFT